MPTPQRGHTQSSGRSSKAVPGSIPLSGSPCSVSYTSVSYAHLDVYKRQGRIDGIIAKEKRGNAGFGYDPLFIPNGYQQSFAELGETIKNHISHRAKAVEKLAEYLHSKINETSVSYTHLLRLHNPDKQTSIDDVHTQKHLCLPYKGSLCGKLLR